MKKKILIIITCVAATTIGLLIYNFSRTHAGKEIDKITLHLSCNNSYEITATYHTPDETGVLSKVSLTIQEKSKQNSYEMNSVISASGAKFETSDQKYFFWEHQGTFIFGEEDNTLAECSEKK